MRIEQHCAAARAEYCASCLRKGASAELLRQIIAMRRLGVSPRNCSRRTFSECATGGFTASVGSRVMPTFAATIWRSVSRLVARKPDFSPRAGKLAHFQRLIAQAMAVFQQ